MLSIGPVECGHLPKGRLFYSTSGLFKKLNFITVIIVVVIFGVLKWCPADSGSFQNILNLLDHALCMGFMMSRY